MGLVVVFSVLAALVLLDWGPSIVRWQLAARRARRSRERQAVVQQAPASRSWSAAGSDSERRRRHWLPTCWPGICPRHVTTG